MHDNNQRAAMQRMGVPVDAPCRCWAQIRVLEMACVAMYNPLLDVG